MKTKEEIKEELKQIQINFNPNKSTYKIIDNVIKENMSTELMIKNLYSIKGVSKYPENLKEKYFKIIENLQNIFNKEKEEENKKLQEDKTKELKDLINSLEKRKIIKKEPEKQIKEEEEKPKVIEQKKEIKPQVIEKKPKENLQENKEKSKKIFSCLLVLIAICIIVGVLLIIFM